ALSHVLNYPNPFTTHTRFSFEHNHPGETMFVTIKIMTVSGKVIKTLQQEVVSDGFRVDDITWDGLDEYGEIIGRGVYVYKLNVRTPEGASAHEFEKLVILR
ncbi:MAG TPA: T9SS type A sorting domain-containing protein, partial [Chitinophagales bacterium]|nr:T9SS type A sorting domain-containing protein [Chitinophagales bacterium]